MKFATFSTTGAGGGDLTISEIASSTGRRKKERKKYQGNRARATADREHGTKEIDAISIIHKKGIAINSNELSEAKMQTPIEEKLPLLHHPFLQEG